MRGYEKAFRRFDAGQKAQNEFARSDANVKDPPSAQEPQNPEGGPEDKATLEHQEQIAPSGQEKANRPNPAPKNQRLLRAMGMVIIAYAMGAISAGLWFANDSGTSTFEVAVQATPSVPEASQSAGQEDENPATLEAPTPAPPPEPAILATTTKQALSQPQPQGSGAIAPAGAVLATATKQALSQPQPQPQDNGTAAPASKVAPTSSQEAAVAEDTQASSEIVTASASKSGQSKSGQIVRAEPTTVTSTQSAGSKQIMIASVAPSNSLDETPGEAQNTPPIPGVEETASIESAGPIDEEAPPPEPLKAETGSEADTIPKQKHDLGLELKKSDFAALTPARAAPAAKEITTHDEPAREAEPTPEPSGEPSDAPTDAPIVTLQAAAEIASPLIKEGFMLQMAAVSNRTDADAVWKNLQSKFPDLMADLALYIEVADVNGKTYHRVQTGPFAEKSAALELCSRLKAGNQDCLVKKKSP